MKKTSKKQSVNKKTSVSSQLPKKDLATIIVLAVCGVIFLGMFLWLHSEDILGDKSDIFNPYGNELVEFEKATVKAITDEKMETDEYAEGACRGSQELSVIVKSGRYKGEVMTIYNYFGPLSGVPVEIGDSVTITIKTHSDGSHSATVYEFNRIPIIGVFIAVFFLSVRPV